MFVIVDDTKTVPIFFKKVICGIICTSVSMADVPLFKTKQEAKEIFGTLHHDADFKFRIAELMVNPKL